MNAVIAPAPPAGKAIRAAVPRSSQAEWAPSADRRDPIELLEEQDALARGREVARERSASGTGSDDDHVVAVHCVLPR